MPKITIEEKNSVRNLATIGTDIPYIPGFPGEDNNSAISVDPVIFTSVSEFKRVIGTKPHKFTEEQKDSANLVIAPAGTCDKSYIMALELLKQGMPVYYHAFDVSDVETFYVDLLTYLQTKDLADRSEYTVKYLTTGGYPNIGVTYTRVTDLFSALLDVATDRKDCIAIAEYPNVEGAVLTGTGSFVDTLNSNITTYGSEYATAFYPFANHIFDTKYEGTTFECLMPACYSYLISLAKSIKTNPNWLAIAGVGRGYVPSIDKLNLTNRLSNTIADTYQPTEGDNIVALNAITNIKPYGYTIWGNRTLKPLKSGEKLNPTHFLNTRNMISDIKKVCYSAAKALMFEQNSELLWLDFKGRITPYLERLSAGNGISGYSILKTDIKSDGTVVSREELACIIRIYPISAVESFDIMIDISDSDVSVAE